MAAILTVDSAYLGSDGLTVTANIGSVSGSLEPASDITGFKVKGAARQYPTSAVTSSGSVVTITLSAPIGAGVTVTVDLAASPTSNLTDTGANTPTGQTNVATTNSSALTATNYDIAGSEFSKYGRITGPSGGYHTWNHVGDEVVFVANATDVTMGGIINGAFLVSVDGGAYSTVTPVVTGADVTAPVASGLSAAEHTIVVKRNVQALTAKSTNSFQVFGGTRVLRAPSTSDGDGYGPYLQLGAAAFSNCGQVDNLFAAASWGASPGSYTSAHSADGNYNNCRFRVRCRAGNIKIFMLRNAARISWSKDGVIQGVVTSSSDSRYGFETICTGQDDGSEHVFTFTCNLQTTTWLPDAVMIVGATSAFSSSPVSTLLPGLVAYGDSITAGVQLTDPNTCWVTQIGAGMAKVPWNLGIQSTLVEGTGTAGQARTGTVTALVASISHCFVMYGVNDLAAEGETNPPTSGFSSAYQEMLTELIDGTTTTLFYILGITPLQGCSPENLALWNGSGNGVQGSITAVKAARPSSAYRLIYVDTEAWNMAGPNGTDFSVNFFDAVHPNQAGNNLIAAGILNIIGGISGIYGSLRNERKPFKLLSPISL